MNDQYVIKELLHYLCVALPFVEDAEHDESYKPEIVRFHLHGIKEAIRNAERHLNAEISDNQS